MRSIITAIGAAFCCMILCSCSSIPPSTSMPLSAERLAPVAFMQFCARSPKECPAGQDGRTLNSSADAQTAETISDREHRLMQNYWKAVFSTRRTAEASRTRPALETIAAQEAQPSVEKATEKMTPALWAHISRVNRHVNESVVSASDQAVYGQPDVWSLPTSFHGRQAGDCEDIALQKRHDLIAEGLSAKALAIALVKTPGGRDHAVLVVSTDLGDYVLDSLTPWVTAWRALNYRWISVQNPMETTKWFAVGQAARIPADARGPSESEDMAVALSGN